MKSKKFNRISAITMALLLSVAAGGCSTETNGNSGNSATTQSAITTAPTGTAEPTNETSAVETDAEVEAGAEAAVQTASDLFTDRDLAQTADLAAATSLTLESGKDVTLTNEGVYVLSGEAENTTVVVEAAEDAKVQIVLDGVRITNEDAPAIYVKAGDKAFVTTTDSESYMEVSGTYTADGETNLDAVIFSRSDITLNGTGALEIAAPTGNGISSKDDVKITGGEYTIQSSADGLEANDAILIHDGSITIDSGKDALHSENDEDASLGQIIIEGGALTLSAADDGIRANSLVQIDGGTVNIENSEEGIEANYIRVNNGQITLYAKNDGMNAAQKIDSEVAIEVNGGTLDLSIGSGDTDAFDSNGNIYINGGTINVDASSAFDFDGTGQLNGGNVTVNGQTVTEMTASRGGGRGGRR
ncbi:carbohydrate-binding domain-containing protein [Paenibacillus soyae]|uniref:Carbohydrate-binding domain-containing protein n=1 Tax=Paenibacillus soyae TaxID=2969249 RepID=A0A9X2MVT3_9BACL|nr:carbohydrate-binding domain-containing protein [Paenibacillus soyae]MCR2804537.1 carbohydrate-binding domain-containing protein [Paenibacillus soyae]